MSKISLLISTTTRILIILLIFCTLINSNAQNSNPTSSSCIPSPCGNIRTIRYPFRLSTDPRSCGYNSPNFVLECMNNQAILRSRNRIFNVQEIDYEHYSIRLVDPNINGANLSSCPVYSNGYDDWPWNSMYDNILDNVPVAFIHCLNPVNNSRYVRSVFCGNRSSILANSSEIVSYVTVGNDFDRISDLEESCTVDRVDRASARRPWRDNSTLANIYDNLAYGFELTWYRVHCGECERNHGTCSLEGNRVSCIYYCREDVPISELNFNCQAQYWGLIVGAYALLVAAGIVALRLLFGIPFLVGVVIYRWRRRHLSTDESPKNDNESV